jgi:hypothetical protein
MAFFTPEARELIEYINDLNAKVGGAFELTTDLSHWAGYGITTKEELGDYLDDCVQREQKKYDSTESNDDDYDGGWDPIEPSWDAVSRHDCNEGW